MYRQALTEKREESTETSTDEQDKEKSFESFAQSLHKEDGGEKEEGAVSKYLDLRFILPTLNFCEALFSRAGFFS